MLQPAKKHFKFELTRTLEINHIQDETWRAIILEKEDDTDHWYVYDIIEVDNGLAALRGYLNNREKKIACTFTSWRLLTDADVEVPWRKMLHEAAKKAKANMKGE